MRRTTTVVTAALLLVSTIGASIATAGTIRTVALSGELAPGGIDGAVFAGSTTAGNGGFSFAILNDLGQAAFKADVIGPGREGIWSEAGGAGLGLVARGEVVGPGAIPAPGVESDVFFHLFIDPVLNDAGQTAFFANLFGPGVDAAGGTNSDGIWSEGGGAGLALVARTGDPAPGTEAGVLFRSLSRAPLLNDAGQVAFSGGLGGPGVSASNDQGIWSEGAGAGLDLVAREGAAAPDTESGSVFAALTEPVLNGGGHTAFRAYLSGPNVSGGNDSGIWTQAGGAGLVLRVREGDAAPGLAAGVSFGSFDASFDPLLNDADQTAFRARLTGTGVDSSNDTSIWSDGGGGGLELVAREGDPAPGTESGVVFRTFQQPVLNGAGQTAFRALLAGPGVDPSNFGGIWSEGRGAGLELIARRGDPAPGAESGAVFLGFFEPHLNGAGQTIFRASAAVPGDPPRLGIWAEHPSGGLRLVARIGDLLDVDDGPGADLREISALFLVFPTGNEDGRRRGFNDRGQLAFKASFSDGSNGIFVFEPDPSLSITSLADGEVVDAGEVLVEGVASDDGEVVSVIVNGIAAELASTGNPGDPSEVSFSATVPLESGENAILAIATDDDGNSFEASVVIESQPVTERLACDVDGNGAVDRADIAVIFGARGSVATGPDDPRDANGDGLISVNDGRLCVLACTNPLCAPTSP